MTSLGIGPVWDGNAGLLILLSNFAQDIEQTCLAKLLLGKIQRTVDMDSLHPSEIWIRRGDV